jgi:hypothetical protein
VSAAHTVSLTTSFDRSHRKEERATGTWFPWGTMRLTQP